MGSADKQGRDDVTIVNLSGVSNQPTKVMPTPGLHPGLARQLRDRLPTSWVEPSRRSRTKQLHRSLSTPSPDQGLLQQGSSVACCASGVCPYPVNTRRGSTDVVFRDAHPCLSYGVLMNLQLSLHTQLSPFANTGLQSRQVSKAGSFALGH